MAGQPQDRSTPPPAQQTPAPVTFDLGALQPPAPPKLNLTLPPLTYERTPADRVQYQTGPTQKPPAGPPSPLEDYTHHTFDTGLGPVDVRPKGKGVKITVPF